MYQVSGKSGWMKCDALTDQDSRGGTNWMGVGKMFNSALDVLVFNYFGDIQLEPSNRLLNIWV